MKKLAFLFVIFFFLASSLFAQGLEMGKYRLGLYGMPTPTIGDYNNIAKWGAGVQFRFERQITDYTIIGLQYAWLYNRSDITNANFDINSYHLLQKTFLGKIGEYQFNPYLAAEVGSDVKVHSIYGTTKKIGFGAGVGCQYEFWKSLLLDFEISYSNLGDGSQLIIPKLGIAYSFDFLSSPSFQARQASAQKK